MKFTDAMFHSMWWCFRVLAISAVFNSSCKTQIYYFLEAASFLHWMLVSSAVIHPVERLLLRMTMAMATRKSFTLWVKLPWPGLWCITFTIVTCVTSGFLALLCLSLSVYSVCINISCVICRYLLEMYIKLCEWRHFFLHSWHGLLIERKSVQCQAGECKVFF